jgi:hypothetical protein
MSAQSVSISQPATLVERWLESRRHGSDLPTYESVVLGRLGRLADCCALIATSDRQVRTITWTGPSFAEWLEDGRSNISLGQLPVHER